MTSFVAQAAGILDRVLSASASATRVGVCTITAGGLVATALALPGSYSIQSLANALWPASPILWWCGWALLQANKPRPSRVALTSVGTILTVVLVAFHLMARHDVGLSSTGVFVYLTGPLFILIGTVIATKIASNTANSPGPKTITFSKPPG